MDEENDYSPRYRYVNDYGYGDGGYEKRDMTEAEALAFYNERHGTSHTAIEAVMPPRCFSSTHYIEGEWVPEEDWDRLFPDS